MNMHSALSSLRAACLCLTCFAACAEGSDGRQLAAADASAGAAAASDAAAVDSQACVESPRTSLEILNACTDDDVEAVDKKPVLPLLLEDGGLPALP